MSFRGVLPQAVRPKRHSARAARNISSSGSAWRRTAMLPPGPFVHLGSFALQTLGGVMTSSVASSVSSPSSTAPLSFSAILRRAHAHSKVCLRVSLPKATYSFSGGLVGGAGGDEGILSQRDALRSCLRDGVLGVWCRSEREAIWSSDGRAVSCDA